MKKIIFIISFLIFFVIVFSFLYLLILDRNPSEIPSVLINKEVPNFKTSSLFNNKNFDSIKIFNNETIIVNFFASWCKPCQIEHRYIEKLSKQNIKIIGINYKDKTNDAIKWLNKLGNPYHSIAQDMNGEIAIDWGVYGIPETFIIGSKNIIRYRHVGPITKNNYNNFYSKILKIQKND